MEYALRAASRLAADVLVRFPRAKALGYFLRVCFFVSDYEGDPSSPADCDAASRLAMAKICDVRFTIFAIRGVAT